MQPLIDIIKVLRAKKSLGQNFLIDPHILGRIVEAAQPLDGRTVIEVGAGPGGLSREIIKSGCAEVFLIEQDTRCIPYLDSLKAHFKGPFTLIEGDATKLPLHTLGKAPRKIIANLPYNVSIPLLLEWLKHIEDFESLTLMFQKEVANRMMAIPNTLPYGRLSIICQTYAHVRRVLDLPPGAFFPPPKVSSTLVQLTPRKEGQLVPWDKLEKVTQATFSKRRKMLRSSLKGLFPLSQLEALGIQPTSRAEDLSIEDFALLASLWNE